MHGRGERRKCPECHQIKPTGIMPGLSWLEIRGPRNITSSNIDRIFDDNGRFLFIEEKHENEDVPRGQYRMLQALAEHHDVWIVCGSPDRLTIWDQRTGGVIAKGDATAYQAAVHRWFSAYPYEQ